MELVFTVIFALAVAGGFGFMFNEAWKMLTED